MVLEWASASRAMWLDCKGKSTLTLALLRCIVTEGDVFYDGINTKDLNLDVLRSNITIIPQVVSCYRAHGPLAASSIMIRL